MRLVEGTDLSQLIARTGPMVVARAVQIVSQVADALDAAHADGLIHRDVKPSNVLVATNSKESEAARDFCYLIDFGIARRLDGRGATALTATDALIGSIDYIAPERLTGGPGDRRVDVYALACVLYEALTGGAPFRGDHAAVMYAHVHRPAPLPSALRPGLPPDLDDVVARGLAKEPDARFSSAGALAAAARAALAAEPSPQARERRGPTVTDVGSPAATPTMVGPASVAPPARRLSRRRLLALSGAGLAAVGAVVVPAVLADRDASPLDDLPARSPTYARMVSRGRVVIGTRGDQPGLSESDPSTGGYTGFDVAIASLISDRLGFAADRVEYPPSLREDAIASGEIDYYVGTYAITEGRKQRVSFAGPYLTSDQGLLVRADESGITGAGTLRGRRVCGVTASTPLVRVRELALTEPENIVEARSYGECVGWLLDRQVDTLITDDVILAGYVVASEGRLRLVQDTYGFAPLAEYGIGLAHDDAALRAQINTILQAAFDSGEWARIYAEHLGVSGRAGAPPGLRPY
jgi:glutamate transport system substrate-binding protein